MFCDEIALLLMGLSCGAHVYAMCYDGIGAMIT